MARTPQVFVLSRRGQDCEDVRRRFELDQESEPAPYGFNLAEKIGWDFCYSVDRPATRLSRAFFARFEFDFFHALDNLAAIRRADIVWTMLEWEWLGVALLQRLGLAPRRPVIANSVWLSEKWSGHPRAKRAFLKWLMLPHFEMTLHSRRGQRLLEQALPQVPWRLSPFGISTRGYPITPPCQRAETDRPIKVYAIGNDGTRDWSTMLKAFGNDQRFDMTIACQWLGPDVTAAYENLRTPQLSTISDFRAEYTRADLVIIPMIVNSYSGITVALEAAAMGKPVISAATGGVDTYFRPEDVLFVPPNDPDALRDAALNATRADLFERARRAQVRFLTGG
jgi:glycosyltransferase involved in cell wall biosynthesis